MSWSDFTSQVHVLRLRPVPPPPRRPLALPGRLRRLPPRHRDVAQRPAAVDVKAARDGGARGGCEAAAVGDAAWTQRFDPWISHDFTMGWGLIGWECMSIVDFFVGITWDMGSRLNYR